MNHANREEADGFEVPVSECRATLNITVGGYFQVAIDISSFSCHVVLNTSVLPDDEKNRPVVVTGFCVWHSASGMTHNSDFQNLSSPILRFHVHDFDKDCKEC